MFIFDKHCLKCHGGVKQQGGLSFLFREAALDTTESGSRAIVPGDLTHSEMIHRISSDDPDLMMPPEGDRLSAEEVEKLKRWIEEGAKWSKHWAYQSIRKEVDVPKSKSNWGNNEIDAFVEETAKSKGLQVTEEAEPASLLRRVSFDLIGLPPSEEIVQKHLSEINTLSYERVVDQLLDSEHYGERWAAMWMDLARYADSQGYQKDKLRPTMWAYRDWVINAFNQDMPFDQFTIEQLAGDLLEAPDKQQLLATAFHRNTMTNDEGGTDDEEYRVAAVMDRVSTTYEVWQATTISCVQCHSHPYDPIRHDEYYKLYATFNNTSCVWDVSGTQPNINTPTPLEYCDPDSDGFGQFDLTSKDIEITGGDPSLLVSYHETIADSNNDVNPLSSPYINIVQDIQTVYVRVEISAIAPDCATIVELILIVNPLPAIVLPTPLEVCDDGTPDGFTSIDLTIVRLQEITLTIL